MWVGAIVLGPSIESLFFVLMLLYAVTQFNGFNRLKNISNNNTLRALGFIVLWTSVSVFWAPHWDQETWFSLKKAYRLLLLPVIILAFDDNTAKPHALHYFLLMMSITALLAAAKYSHLLTWRDDDPGHLFYNHIITGFMAAFAAYLSLMLFLPERRPIYLLLWSLFSFQVMVLNPGKMACVLYLTLMLYWLFAHAVEHLTWKTIMLIGGSLLGLLLVSPIFRQGVLTLLQDSLSFQHGNRATSLGFRVQFHEFAWKLFKQHWLIGNGAGAYAYWFKQLQPVPEWLAAPNTHSQYWLIAAESGLIGLMLWINWFVLLWREASRRGAYGQYFSALLIILLLNSCTDNVMDVSIGYLFLAFAALAFSAPERNALNNTG